MELSFPKSISKQKIARYLGDWRKTPDPATMRLIDSACSNIRKNARPFGTYKRISIRQASFMLKGNDIQQHVCRCFDCLLMAVTLGTQTDAMIRRLETQSIAEAAAADAAASVAVEQIADQIEQDCRARLKEEGLFLTSRFSPGYGDCPLSTNQPLLQILDAPKRIGLTCTSTNLLAPRKSITAICGISDQPVKGKRAGCEHCVLREKCSFRKKGHTCAE